MPKLMIQIPVQTRRWKSLRILIPVYMGWCYHNRIYPGNKDIPMKMSKKVKKQQLRKLARTSGLEYSTKQDTVIEMSWSWRWKDLLTVEAAPVNKLYQIVGTAPTGIIMKPTSEIDRK
ncbi:uncharacterized protein LOC126183677 isoform X4 [Schistocerca cancellata]|uniref:uncharacterized protein LOC126183677 isoform X3 n=1 Tax=Schistocerca cancellata TaxID=274614 RepID=UPI002118D6BD|nr:uncharacterized protein LOC126183677 isoform X3 [Schistocerca cancellata]XP_049781801.1 uncharacterized protein LOC126183677 isoform X4 [Schistocerca cancellata]